MKKEADHEMVSAGPIRVCSAMPLIAQPGEQRRYGSRRNAGEGLGDKNPHHPRWDVAYKRGGPADLEHFVLRGRRGFAAPFLHSSFHFFAFVFEVTVCYLKMGDP